MCVYRTNTHYVYKVCALILTYVGPSKKRKKIKEEEEEEDDDDERVAVIDTGMFSVKVRIYVCTYV